METVREECRQMPKTNLILMIVENIGICVQNNIFINLYFHGKYMKGYIFLKFGKGSTPTNNTWK